MKFPFRIQTPIGYLVSMLLLLLIYQSLTVGVLNGGLTTLEVRYGFTATQLGSLSSVFSASKLVWNPIVSYFISKSHVPRMMGVFILIFAFSCFLGVLPQFFSEAYLPPATSSAGTCGSSAPDCDSTTSTSAAAFGVLVLSRFIMGLGSAPFQSVGPVFLAKIAPRRAGLYIGIMYAGSMLGPVMGSLGGGLVLDAVWVDGKVPDYLEGIKPTDARWVGNWWVAILTGGFAMVLVSLLFFSMPREFEIKEEDKEVVAEKVDGSLPRETIARMPTLARTHSIREKEPGEEDGQEGAGAAGGAQGGAPASLKDVVKTVKEIICNPLWLFVVIASAMELFAVDGYTAFGGKYVQEVFSQSAGSAGLLIGVVIVPSIILAFTFSGIWESRYKPNMANLAKFNMLMALIAAVWVFAIAFIGCPNADIVGANIDVAGQPLTEISLDYACNAGCGCATTYAPVCGSDGRSYFSACVAGCQNVSVSDIIAFTNCNCVRNSTAVVGDAIGHFTATPSVCLPDCTALAPFLFMFFCFFFFTFCNNVPSQLLVIRCTPHSMVAMALTDMAAKLLGSIPGPLVFGAIFDASCQVLTPDVCGEPGSTPACSLYDVVALRYLSFGLFGFGCKLLSAIFTCFAWRYALVHYAHVVVEKQIAKAERESEEMAVVAGDAGAEEGEGEEQVENGEKDEVSEDDEDKDDEQS